MTLREKIETMQAFERGEEIECATAGYDTSWHYVKTPSWNWKENDYRIKPNPKQVVVIEKWLCKQKGKDSYWIMQGNVTYSKDFDLASIEKVKLLDTYEVEI